MYNGTFTDKLKLLFKLHIPPGKWEVVAFGEACSWLLSSLHDFFFSLALLFFLLSPVQATAQFDICNADAYFFPSDVLFGKDLICSDTISLIGTICLYKAFALLLLW